VLLPENVSEESMEARLPEINEKYKSGRSAETEFHTLQPLREIHFDERYGDFSQKTSRAQLLAIGLIALFLITIACVNFVNLATAQAMRRGKEVGIRKVLGSFRWQLISQFMGETLLITLISIVLAFGILQWMLPVFNNFIEETLSFQPLEDTTLLLFLGGVAVLTALLAGLYPALLLSGFQPAKVLKGQTLDTKVGGISLRRSLVGFQFFIAQVLIVTTLVIVWQTHYMSSASMGFDTEARITVPMPDNTPNALEAFRNRLSENPHIASVSFGSDPPASGSSSWTSFTLENQEEISNFTIQTKMGDEHYLDTYGLTLVAGRNMHPSDTLRELLVNEKFLEKLGMRQPEEIIGKRIKLGGNAYVPVVGVVADFHTRSLRNPISPCIIASNPSQYWYAGILMSKKAPVQEVLSSIEQAWKATYPEGIFDYDFLDESIASFYQEEKRMSQILTIFAVIAIFISCLGLYGLASFMAAKRTKEVGIRKVLGASVQQIVLLFSKEFVWLVAIAFLIATPLTWYLMHQWLQDFAHRIDLNIGIFLLAGMASLLIALVTVSYRSLKTAMSNPVNSLRSE
jgi:ABC-type lipoprotein release transport system permease subunit